MAVSAGRTIAPDLIVAARQSALLSDVSISDCAEIFLEAHEKEFERHENISFEGDPIHQVLLLIDGCAKVTRLGYAGNEVILRVNGAGDIVGALGFLCGAEHRASTQALTRCRVLAWKRAAFDNVCDRFPVLRRNTARIAAEQLQELEERFHELATERVGKRVAHELVRLLTQIGRPIDGVIGISLSRRELAQMTGATLYTISRLLSEWRELGILDPRHKGVVVRDLRGLERIYQDDL
jgi:CRP-like cAMP-binding protein